MPKKKTASRPIKHNHSEHALKISLIIIGMLVVGFVGGYVLAKARYVGKIHDISVMFSNKDAQMNMMLKGQPDKIMMQNGRVMMTKNGSVNEIEDPVTLKDGTKVMPDGSYQRPGEDVMMMQNGDVFDMNGQMMQYGK